MGPCSVVCIPWSLIADLSGMIHKRCRQIDEKNKKVEAENKTKSKKRMLMLVRKKSCQKTSSHDTAISPQECCKAHFVSQGHTPGMPCILNLTTTHQTSRLRHGTICNFPFQESILFDRSLSLIAKQRRLPYNPPLIYLKKNLLQIASR